MNNKTRIFRRTLKCCGSTLLGAALMTASALAMGWATFVEREMGTPVAQRIIYASNWFYVLIGALGLNVLCSALVRLPAFIRRVPDGAPSAAATISDANVSNANSSSAPTKIAVERRLIPFYLAHLGILVLLAGCLATALCGTQARMTIPEGTAVEKALDVNARLFDVELVDLTSPSESEPKKLDIPFSGGSLNWRDCASYNSWKQNVSEPLLAKMNEGSFFKDLAKGAAKWSQKAAFLAANVSRTQRPGTLYDRDGFKIEILDYATIYDFAPVEPLAATLTLKKPDGKTAVEKFELAFPNDATPPTDALSASRRAVRQTLTDGVRVVYMLTDSNAEAAAFLKNVPTKNAATDDKPSENVAPQDVKKNDVVVLSVDGERFQILLTDLAPLAYSGSSDEQRASLETQRAEIKRRLDLERKREDATPDNAAELKPLQTVKREDLERNAAELSQLLRSTNELLAASADKENGGATDDSALVEARQKYSQLRLLNYLASAWAQLESGTATSKEFCEALEKMLNDTESRLTELDRLDAASRLGETGWRIVGFETSPTLVSNVDELQGWTALIQLESPQGDKCETTLYSELAERNRYPENGRVFGALWLDRFEGTDSEYGRPWNPALSKPKLELAQTPDGALYYRYNNGLNDFQTGRLETKTLDAALQTVAVDSIALTDVATRADSTVPTAFSLTKVVLQTELGYRFTPGAFEQEKANEFYGTAKIRVTLDDAIETFWIRTIPLESVSEEQVNYLTKRVVSSKRAATIRLTDRELDLGVALFVKKFTPVYEPGSTTAASFSSLVRVLPQGLSAEEQAAELAKNADADVLIQMNRPGVLRSPQTGRAFWAYQDSFRGPYRPGDPEFEQVVDGRLLPGETTPRETLYSTTITLNDDPGRGLKYLGSLLLVLGTAFLIYRKSPKSATMPNSNATSSTVKTSGAKTLASTLAFLAATFFASATFAQESSQAQPVKEKDVASPTVSLNSPDATKNFATTNAQIDWKTWRLLPVFADGRRQPLNTFAEILVRDVCGTATPVFAVPEETLTRLESGKPLNFPELEDVLKDVAPEKRAERTAAFNEISAGVVERQREIAAKIRATFPNGTRRFEAPELIFSWLVEPEIWDYIPFINDAQAVVSQGVFSRSTPETASRFSRLAPEDFERLDGKSGRTVVENFRATSGQNSPEIVKALGETERRLTLFRSVSFVPTQAQSTRPSRYLQRILYGAPSSGSPHSGMSPSASPLAKLDAATRNIERLISTTDKDLQSESPFSNGDFLLRQTEKFSQNGREVEALKIAKAFYLLEMQNVATPTPANGERFETLTVAVGDALSELRAHRDAIFAAGTFSDEYRRELLKCVDALSEIADSLELAYLSTTAELPKTLDVVPVVRRREFRLTESQESPWVPLQTLLWAPDSLFARFVDPSLAPELQGLSEDATPSSSTTPSRKRETPPTLDEQTISPFATFDDALRKTLDLNVYERPVTEAFLEAALAYRDVAAPNRAERFNASLERFASELRSLAERSEPFRVALATEEVADERLRTSFLAKTAYPAPNALDAEFLYNRLNPFYWNWVACLFAVVALGASYCRQTYIRLRHNIAQTKEMVPTQSIARSDASKATPFEERFFFVVGFVFLALSCVVAFLGGAIRAYITGWAPVTNMFETVVLLAFLIAAIAIGYALFPAWGGPFSNAWRVSAFPGRLRDATSEELRVSRLLRWPRIVAIVFCVVAAIRLCYREEMFVSGDSLTRVVLESFAMQGILDRCAILGAFFFIAWSVPRFLAAVAALVVFPQTTLCRDDLRAEIPDELQDAAEHRAALRRLIASQIVQRKAFLTVSSIVALLVAAAAYFNSSEFNPNIRPLAAVLRSNFWLTIHVFAIIASYALGAIAWAVALSSLTVYIFGRYNAVETSRSDLEATRLTASKRRERRRAKPNKVNVNQPNSNACNATDDWDPAYCRRVSGIIATMIRSAVLFLTVGIILGARWADFSWGRFWSWDPKEVWALVTLLIYLVVLHILKVKRCGRFGLAVGATLGALAIVMTWYGLSFVMGGGGRHSYAAGESNKVAVLYLLFVANLLWTFVATVRYHIAKAGRNLRNGKR